MAELVSEIERYLSTVALFRELGHEPCWVDEAVEVPILQLRVAAGTIAAGGTAMAVGGRTWGHGGRS